MTEIAFRPGQAGKPAEIEVDGVVFLPATAVDLDALALQKAAEAAIDLLRDMERRIEAGRRVTVDLDATRDCIVALEAALDGVQYAAAADVDVIGDRGKRYVELHGLTSVAGSLTPLELQLLNVAEEAAELASAAARAVLKRRQGIRENEGLLGLVWKEIGDTVFSSTLACVLAGKQPSQVILDRIAEIEGRGPDAREQSAAPAPPALKLPELPELPRYTWQLRGWPSAAPLGAEGELLFTKSAAPGDAVPEVALDDATRSRLPTTAWVCIERPERWFHSSVEHVFPDPTEEARS